MLRTLTGVERSGVSIVFESDYEPAALARFIAQLGPDFGVNYDIGNSASLGFDPAEEIGAYGARIRNVHVKDRVRGGTTVPLGTGGDFRRTLDLAVDVATAAQRLRSFCALA